jgi:hypothetical protein
VNSTGFVRVSLIVSAMAGIGVGLLAPAALASPAAGTAGTRPVIEVPETKKDGGVVEEGTVVPFRFTVANRGAADLEITQVRPSCGCTITKWDRVVKPGGQSVVEASMNTLYFHGAVAKHLTVISNDPDRPQMELTITARVTPLVKISPSTAALLSVDDRPVTQEFTLERSGGHPMKIAQVIPNAPYLKTEVTPLPGEGRYKLAVTATMETPFGRSTVPLVVRTDLQKGGMLTFVLTVDRGIVIVPPMIFYGMLPHHIKVPPQATVTITRISPAFHVKSVTADDPKLAPRLETVRDGAEYRVTVTYAGGWEIGLKRQTLTILTDDPKQPEIKIPIQAVVQADLATEIRH